MKILETKSKEWKPRGWKSRGKHLGGENDAGEKLWKANFGGKHSFYEFFGTENLWNCPNLS